MCTVVTKNVHTACLSTTFSALNEKIHRNFDHGLHVGDKLVTLVQSEHSSRYLKYLYLVGSPLLSLTSKECEDPLRDLCSESGSLRGGMELYRNKFFTYHLEGVR